MKKCLQVIVIALAFALASVPAWALGLGQIQVKSRLNEPFLAHIPIISNDPAELQELSAKLADPETFIRVGLPLPDRLVSDLHFAIETGDDGKPYVKVTSTTPVTLTELYFLVEVQWSDGRLVREYSALMAPPGTIAGTPPVIEAPTAAADNRIERVTPVATEVLPAPAPTPDVRPRETAASSPDADAVTAASAGVARVSASGRTYGPIRPGETLGEIARALAGPDGDAESTMQKLLQLNGDAFIAGNLNRLKAGAVLQTPEGSVDVKSLTSAERSAVANAAPSVANRGARDAEASTVANVIANPTRSSAAAAPRASREARLKILAPTANIDSPTTRSGGGKQGDGDMLQQQLQQANETLATKDAEINDLKSRVAELEQLKNKQAQLIAIKDTQLASAQKNLETRPSSGKEASVASPFPWVGLSLGLLAAAVLAGIARAFLRRNPAKPAGTAGWMQGAPDGPRPSAAKGRFAPDVAVKDADSGQGAQVDPKAGDDHEALSTIAKARACMVVGDKGGARAMLEGLLSETLLPDTRAAAEQLLRSIR